MDRALDGFLRELEKTLTGKVSTDAPILAAASGDESGLSPVPPAAVVVPRSAADIVVVAREAAHRGVPLVPRGGGTGKAGACIPTPGSVVVDLTGMNRLLELHPSHGYAVVEPGLITGEFDALLAPEGLLYPPDPGSLESCTLGGNIATNAGGPRAVKYGVTHRYVWGLTVVLPGGDLIQTGKRSLKGVAGLDVTSLLVGSEGTLGFVAGATLRVISRPADVQTAWLTFADVPAACSAADAIFRDGLGPRILELMDRTAMGLARSRSAFAIPQGGAGLLVETDGPEGEALEELLRLCSIAVDQGAMDSAVAKNEKEREQMRRARRLVSSSMKEDFPLKLSDDLAVPRGRMPDLLARAEEIADGVGIPFSAYGHLGDGNLHINLLCRDAQQREAARAAQLDIVTAALRLGGTVTGEHGIGIGKRDQLPLEHGAELLALQRRLKVAFDPDGIMNPGKVLY